MQTTKTENCNRIAFWLPKELVGQLQQMATLTGVSQANIVRRGIYRELEQLKQLYQPQK